MNKWEKIENILKKSSTLADDISRDELIEHISIYHEELIFQNEELSRVNKYLEAIKNDYQELFDFSPVAYFIINKEGTVIEANAKVKGLFGNVLDKSITACVEPGDYKNFHVFLKNLFKENTSRINAVFVSWGIPVHMEVIGNQIASRQDHFFIACIDFEQHYRTMEKISDLSYKDKLTGLYNRRYFEREIFQTKTQKDIPYSVIMADVNGLKVLNDVFGHSTGDELLRIAAQVMCELSGKNHVIARIGGDEFAVLLPNVTEMDCKVLMNQLHEACLNLQVNSVRFSISFGSATMTLVTEDFESVIACAEKEMYKSKFLNEAANSSEMVESIFGILCKRCAREELNSKRVAGYMKRFGEYSGYDQDRIDTMHLAGLFHNIGKVAVDPVILDKKTSLSAEDYTEIRKSPEIAYRILKSSSKFSKIAHIILYSHEWVNGKGYPKGLTREDIPLDSRVLGVCEAFVAMTSDKPYGMAMTRMDAFAELEACSGTQFDRDVVKDFVKMVKQDSK